MARFVGGPDARAARVLVSLAAAMVWAAAEVRAQTASVTGRVIGGDTSAGITNAAVELVGRGLVLTTPDGLFRFENVPLREHTLRVTALGYEGSEQSIDLRGDVVLSIVLDIAPLALDSVLVDARQVDFDGRIRDPVRDVAVMDALVLTDLGHEVRTNQRGDFDVDDVLENSAVRFRVYAFGYLPADTTLIADGEERQEIELVRDTLVERLIAMQTTRIVERADERVYEHREALDRDALAQFPPSRTVQSILATEYPSRRIFCYIIDERRPLMGELRNLFPHEIERMELLEFGSGAPNAPTRLFMVRIYTRRFFQQLIASNQPLRMATLNYRTRTCT